MRNGSIRDLSVLSENWPGEIGSTELMPQIIDEDLFYLTVLLGDENCAHSRKFCSRPNTGFSDRSSFGASHFLHQKLRKW